MNWTWYWTKLSKSYHYLNPPTCQVFVLKLCEIWIVPYMIMMHLWFLHNKKWHSTIEVSLLHFEYVIRWQVWIQIRQGCLYVPVIYYLEIQIHPHKKFVPFGSSVNWHKKTHSLSSVSLCIFCVIVVQTWWSRICLFTLPDI